MAESDATTHRPGELHAPRWLLVIAGMLSIAAGVIVLAEPAIGLATLAVVTGIFLVVDGITETGLSLFAAHEGRALGVLIGVVSFVVGVVLIRHPIRGVVAIAMLLGLWLIVAGAVRLAWAMGESHRRGWRALLAVIEIAAGIVIVSSPAIGVATLALLVGISFIVRGVAVMGIAWFIGDPAGDPRVAAHGPVTAT